MTRSRIALLLGLAAGCSSPPPFELIVDYDQYVVVRGRVSVEGGRSADLTQVSIHPSTNFRDCTGTLSASAPTTPDASGFYVGTAGIPRALPSRRCVWAIAAARIDGILYHDTAGGVPATFQSEDGRTPPDTVEINIVLRNIGAHLSRSSVRTPRA